jgi:hypothetical protein
MILARHSRSTLGLAGYRALAHDVDGHDAQIHLHRAIADRNEEDQSRPFCAEQLAETENGQGWYSNFSPTLPCHISARLVRHKPTGDFLGQKSGNSTNHISADEFHEHMPPRRSESGRLHDPRGAGLSKEG